MGLEGGNHAGLNRDRSMRLGPGEDRGPRARNRAPEGARGHRGLLDVGESGDQGLALRLDHDIVKGFTDHVEVVRIAAADKPGQVCGLPDEIGARYVRLQNRARLARRELHMRMHQHAAHRLRHGDLLDARMIDADGEHQAAEQARRDVVDMHCAARDNLALDRVLQQLQPGQGIGEQCIGRDHSGNRRGGRSAHARGQRNALVD